MKKLYCIICSRYRKFEKPKICSKCSKCKNEDEKLFTEEEPIARLKFLGLIENI